MKLKQQVPFLVDIPDNHPGYSYLDDWFQAYGIDKWSRPEFLKFVDLKGSKVTPYILDRMGDNWGYFASRLPRYGMLWVIEYHNGQYGFLIFAENLDLKEIMHQVISALYEGEAEATEVDERLLAEAEMVARAEPFPMRKKPEQSRIRVYYALHAAERRKGKEEGENPMRNPPFLGQFDIPKPIQLLLWSLNTAALFMNPPEMPTCPACGTPEAGAYLGQLGRLIWFRCIYCGMDFSKASRRKTRRTKKRTR